ncbi:MAG: cadherin domain-containing protein, partial [Chromatiaceae bacterium]
QITVANSAALDFETNPSFTLTVAAIDPQGAYGTTTITVNLNNLDEAGVNDAPENSVPAAQTIQQDGMLVFSSATGTAISVSDFDAGSSEIQVTLTATNGTLNLSGTRGLSFTPPADGTDDATMTFTGTIADINAALEGATFVASAGFTGTAGVQITTNDQGNTGAGGARSDTDSVAITVAVPDHTLWMTFQNDEATTGNPEIPNITGGDVVNFGGTLTFEPGTTSGTFSKNFNLDLIAGTDGATDVNAMHYVTSDISVGGIDLKAGDLLLSTAANETIGGTTYNKEDVFVYRPTTAGDYSSGSFFLLIDGSAVGYGDVTGISLVEQDTAVGGVTLRAGEFLIAHGGSDKDINRLQADQLGATTTASTSILIQGADINFSSGIGALHLVQESTAIGDTSLQSGQLVVGLVGDDSTVGSGTPIAVLRQDLFVLDVTATGAGSSVATATLFFEGLDESLDSNNETIYGVSAQYNVAPTANDASFAIDENSSNGTVVGSVTASDPESGTLTYAITGGNTDGAFAIDAATGQISVTNSAALDFETNPSFTLTVAAIDPDGAYGTATVTIDLNNLDEPGVNDAPVNSVPGAQTIDQDGMLLFSSATGTAISISDFDAGSNPVEVTLTATNGTINLSGTRGLSFTEPADGTDDATMTFTGTIADINAALEGMTFVATAGFTGAASVQITTDDQGNTGTGGARSDTDSVAINVVSPDQSLWLSLTGTNGVDSFQDPGLVLEDPVDNATNTTSGTMVLGFDIDAFCSTNANVDAVHYVRSDIQLGSSGFQLQAGDLLLSVDNAETLNGNSVSPDAGFTNSLSVDDQHVFVFRPDTPGNYSTGSFAMLLDDPVGDVVVGIALIETDTVVGDETLQAGDFLIIHGGFQGDIGLWETTDVGAGTTSGTYRTLLTGGDANVTLGADVAGVSLVESTTTIGGQTLDSGTLLVTVVSNKDVGSNALPMDQLDIFALDVTTTSLYGAGDAAASYFFEGADAGIASEPDAFTLQVSNISPTVNDAGFSLDENSANGTVVGSVTASDPENGTLSYAITGGNNDGAFAIDATTGQITVADGTLLDFETTPSFTLTVAAIDPQGAYGSATITVNLNDVNTPPVNNLPAAQSTDEDTTLTFSVANGNPISISNDAGDTTTVTLSVDNGTLSLAQTTGLTFDAGANGTATMTFTGTVEDINAALDGLQYTPTADYFGSDTLTLTSRDAELYSLEIDSDLLGRYQFEAAAPGDDSSPGGTNDATLVGDAAITTDAERGDVLSLDGNGDYAEITGNFGNPANVTLAAWVNLTAADTQGSDVINVGDNVGIRLDNPNGGSGVWAYYYDGTTWNNIASGEFVAGDGWVHVAYVFDDVADTHTIYINGTAINSEAATSSISYANAPNTRIGSHANGSTDYDFNGLIDDARVYTRALTPAEIASLANAPVQSSDSDSLSIAVNPVNDAPVITSDGGGDTASVNVAENTTAVTTVVATDADAGDTMTYSIAPASTDAALFNIISSTGELTFISAPNFENPADADNVYEVTVRASDGNGGTDSQAISVTVTDALELEVTNTNATGTGSLHEAI